MKKSGKLLALVAMGALLAALAVVGCSSSSSSSSDSSSSEASYTLVKDGTLTVATSPDFPPFENLEDGEYVGFDMDLGRALAEKLGLEFEPTTLQFDGIIPAVVAGGQCDIGLSGFSVDPERAEEIDFTDAYYVDDQSVVVMKDSGITEDAINAEGVVIAVQSGTTGEDYAKENYPNATVQPYGNATDCFAAMQSGQAQVVCTNKAVAEKMLEDAYTDAEIIKSDATGEEYAIVVSKDNPQLTEALNAALAELEEDGTIDELTQKWFG